MGTVMARIKSFVSLVRVGAGGDPAVARSAAGAIIAEELAQRHDVPETAVTDSTRAIGSRHPASAGTAAFGRRHRQFPTVAMAFRHLTGTSTPPDPPCGRATVCPGSGAQRRF